MENELKTMDQSNVSQRKRSNKNQENAKKKKYWFRIRLIPIWLRVVIVLLLWIFVVMFGLMIGFSVLGDGNALDVLKWGTWQHILDIIGGK